MFPFPPKISVEIIINNERNIIRENGTIQMSLCSSDKGLQTRQSSMTTEIMDGSVINRKNFTFNLNKVDWLIGRVLHTKKRFWC
jgi:hypothetical protein